MRRIDGRRTKVEEEELRLVRAAQADLREFSPLYDRYCHRIYRYIAARVGDRPTAEDLTGQAFLQAIQNLRRYRPDAPFAAWLFTIARNLVASHFRQIQATGAFRGTEDEYPDTQNPGVDEQLEQREEMTRLSRAIGRLDEDDRELLRLRFAGGLTYREAARTLGRSPGAIRMAMNRLLRRLQFEMRNLNDSQV